MLELEAISDLIEGVLARSPADETEVVWLEVKNGRSENRNKQVDTRLQCERTILVRVIDRKRVGSHRTGVAEPGELDSAVRLATAQSRSRDPLPGLLHFPAEETTSSFRAQLWDPQIAALDEKAVARLFRPWLESRGTIRLGWSTARVAVFNSRGVRRRAEATAANLDVRIGRRPGAGRASCAARSLQDLFADQIVDRARKRHASGPAGEAPSETAAVVLSPEATAALVDILNRVAFSAISYYQGSSFLRQHLDVQVFDRSLNLRDDATDPSGLAFPFDLEGVAKRPVDLILKGTPKTPALDQRQAAQLGLAPTAHAIGGNDARAMNLFLLPGSYAESELLETADGGIWIGWMDDVECFEPARVQVRATARGVRRISAGKLAAGLPDLLWDDSLLRAFSSLLGIGTATVQQVSHDGFLGGISAPSLAISGVAGLRLASS